MHKRTDTFKDRAQTHGDVGFYYLSYLNIYGDSNNGLSMTRYYVIDDDYEFKISDDRLSSHYYNEVYFA